MSTLNVLAEAMSYPFPGHLQKLQAGLFLLPEGATKTAFAKFVDKVSELPLAEWEEIHTYTLDLSPQVAPYVGFLTWGESYQRGTFMAQLNDVYEREEISTEGELPDHLIPILHYLEVASTPLPELIEVLEPAIERMIGVLSDGNKKNPYTHLFNAILHAVRLQVKELAVVGGER
ncbi:MAG: nitrate reductase [Chloroflexi bacterium]|nr:MAG: nitrate reductase [Chloroflexota bacterium]MBL1195440.1 nitrate reductase [Chloroflexota bacterium]NOH12723.1 nitrate reductase [Chloroflexota bacterium]